MVCGLHLGLGILLRMLDVFDLIERGLLCMGEESLELCLGSAGPVMSLPFSWSERLSLCLLVASAIVLVPGQNTVIIVCSWR